MPPHFSSFSIFLFYTTVKNFTYQNIVFDDVTVTNDGPDDIMFGDGTTMVHFLRSRASIDFKNLDISQFWMKNPVVSGGALVSCSGTWSD